MSDETDVATSLRRLTTEWEQISEIPATPLSTMAVIEHSLGSQRKAEEYVNRFLRYFLNPEAPHGMREEFLRGFLRSLPVESEFIRDSRDLAEVNVKDQVPIRRGDTDEKTGDEDINNDGEETDDEVITDDEKGIVDLVIQAPNDWYLIVELKFYAGENNLRGEGLSQTEYYYDADRVEDTPKSTYDLGGEYVYLYPEEEDPSRECGFTDWTWEDFVQDFLSGFLARNTVRYPQRTTSQLQAFDTDIRDLIGMDRNEPDNDEKFGLYIEHYEAITDVAETFESEWERFGNNWPDELHRRLEADEQTTDEWTFYQKTSDWAHLFKDGWWKALVDVDSTTTLDELPNVDTRADHLDDLRISLVHRMENNLDQVIQHDTLKLHFRNCGSNPRPFRKAFQKTIEDSKGEIEELLPDAEDEDFSGIEATFTNKMTEFIRVDYKINRQDNDDLRDAYVDALERASKELLFDRPALLEAIEGAYEEAFMGSRDELMSTS